MDNLLTTVMRMVRFFAYRFGQRVYNFHVLSGSAVFTAPFLTVFSVYGEILFLSLVSSDKDGCLFAAVLGVISSA